MFSTGVVVRSVPAGSGAEPDDELGVVSLEEQLARPCPATSEPPWGGRAPNLQQREHGWSGATAFRWSGQWSKRWLAMVVATATACCGHE